MSKTFPPLRRPLSPDCPTVYILIGLPGSGKSTWVKRHLSMVLTRTHVASTDDILERFAIEDGTSYAIAHSTRFKDAEREFKLGVVDAARDRKDIIVDRTNVFQSARRKMIALIESSTPVVYRRVGVIFHAPMEVLRERVESRRISTGKDVPWHVIEGMHKDYQPPADYEFHLIKSSDQP